MKKSPLFIWLSIAFLMCGCSENDVSKPKTNGIIECETIHVIDSSSVLLSASHSSQKSQVYEYVSKNGKKKIYTNQKLAYVSNVNAKIKIYKNHYSTNFEEYSFSKYVGLLLEEDNYYLDFDSNYVIYQKRWIQYPSETIASDSSTNRGDAYSCAKNGYYYLSPTSTDYEKKNGSYYYMLYSDSEESSLSRCVYTKLGSDCSIMYTVKKQRTFL